MTSYTKVCQNPGHSGSTVLIGSCRIYIISSRSLEYFLPGYPDLRRACLTASKHHEDLKDFEESSYGANTTSGLRPKGPYTAHLRTLVPKTIPGTVFGTRVLKWAVYGPTLRPPHKALSRPQGPQDLELPSRPSTPDTNVRCTAGCAANLDVTQSVYNIHTYVCTWTSTMAKMMDPILPILFMLGYWAIVVGLFWRSR